MSLKESVQTLLVLHGAVNKSADQKFTDAGKLKEQLKALDKAKTQKIFDNIKKDCKKILLELKSDVVEEELKVDAWEEELKVAEKDLAKERENFNTTKKDMQTNLKKCQELNESIKKFNETPQGKKKPKPLLPELDPDLELKNAAQALDEAEFTIDSQRALIKKVNSELTRDNQTVKRLEKELAEKEFKDPKKK